VPNLTNASRQLEDYVSRPIINRLDRPTISQQISVVSKDASLEVIP